MNVFAFEIHITIYHISHFSNTQSNINLVWYFLLQSIFQSHYIYFHNAFPPLGFLLEKMATHKA